MSKIIESIRRVVGREPSRRDGWEVLREGDVFAEVQTIRFKHVGLVEEFRVGVGDVGAVGILWWDDQGIENPDNLLYSGLVFVGDPHQERAHDRLSVGFSTTQSKTGWADVCRLPESLKGEDRGLPPNPILTDPLAYKIAVAEYLSEPVFATGSPLGIVEYIQSSRLTT